MKQVIVIGLLSMSRLAGESPKPSVNAALAAAMIPMASRRLTFIVVGCTSFSLPVVRHEYFVYHRSMNVDTHPEAAVSAIAAAIGEPARAPMLYSLMDGHARTSTELAVVAGVTPSTASAHLNRLKTARLVKVLVQGKHRY